MNTCAHDGCPRQRRARGYCQRHYDQAVKRGEFPGVRARGLCGAAGCTTVGRLRRGMCGLHYERWRCSPEGRAVITKRAGFLPVSEIEREVCASLAERGLDQRSLWQMMAERFGGKASGYERMWTRAKAQGIIPLGRADQLMVALDRTLSELGCYWEEAA